MNIVISNLNLLTTTEHLSNLFLPFGLVQSVKIIKDDRTGHSLGFGFIKMNRFSGYVAISELNAIKFMNFYIDVSEAPM